MTDNKYDVDGVGVYHCPYCLSRIGGPLLCCEDGYVNKEHRDLLTASEATEKKEQRTTP